MLVEIRIGSVVDVGYGSDCGHGERPFAHS